jgi:apolipoprotein N-acyltransferase
MSRKFLACLLAAILLALPFLNPFFFPLAWVAFVPLFWAVRQASTGRAFLLGWFSGTVAHVVGFYWLNYTIKVFGGFSYGLSAVIFFLFAISNALPFALFCLVVRQLGLGPLSLFPAALWVALEFVSPALFPWHLADSQSQFLILMQSADLVGPFGTSFLVMWINTALYAAISGTKGLRSAIRDLAVLSTVLLATLLYGHFRLKAVPISAEKTPVLSVAAVQGGIDIKRKWDIAYIESNLKVYQDLTRSSQEADLVVWPEAAVEAWLPENIERLPPGLLPPLKRDTFLMFGARSFRGNPRGPDLKVFNSAFLVDFEGKVLGHYHKQVLLAFGEYIPFAALLSKLPGFPSQIDGFTPGEGPATLDLPGGVKTAPLICYEDVMPSLTRRFVAAKGANLLINLTNDAWFGDTVAPWQHTRLAQWRAIETRRYLVRVTNTGVTSVIDPTGKVLSTLPTFSPGVLTAKVRLLDDQTIYTRFGDWFAWLATAVSLVIVVRKIAVTRKEAP